MSRMHVLMVGLLTCIMTGCMLGPNFKHPEAPTVQRYSSKPLPPSTVSARTIMGNKQYFRQDQDIPKQWWTVFHSRALNQLIIEALSSNPDIQAASASLKVAHENTMVQRAAFFPQIGASYNPTRQLTAGTLQSNVSSNAYLYTLNLASLNVSYAPDVLGLNRRRVESMKAEEETAVFQCEAIHLTLTTNVVLAAINEATLRAQIKTTQQSIKIAAELLKMMRRQRELGQITEGSVAAQAALFAQTKAALPPLQQQLAHQEHLMAALTGHFPSEKRRQQFTLDLLKLPKELPVSLPAKLVQQRPDIRAAEAQMHAASAKIGAAIANRLPNIVLSATGGFAPIDFAASSIPSFLPLLPMGSPGFWGVGANLAGTLFSGGALMHQQRAAVATYELSVAQYRRVVLDAFQQVADTLKAIQSDAEALKIATELQLAARRSFMIASKRWELGSIGYLEVLNAEQVYQQALMNQAQYQANRLADTAALFQALGGGWS